MNTHTQKSVRTLISRAQSALHEANMFNEITSFIDSDIELSDEVHDFLYGSIRKSHAEAFEALELLEKESLQVKEKQPLGCFFHIRR